MHLLVFDRKFRGGIFANSIPTFWDTNIKNTSGTPDNVPKKIVE
jgi:hypothetical protein